MARATFLLIPLCALVTLALPDTQAADAPLTPAGASKIIVKVKGTRGFLFKPAKVSLKADRPWVWYAPTLFRELPSNRRLPNASPHWLFTRLLAKGIWIAGVDAGESYGAPNGRALYSDFYNVVTSKYHLSKKPCFLAQSRGGLMGFGWAAEHSDHVQCIAGIYPVLNLASWPHEGTAELRQAAAAYGFTSVAEFQKQSSQLSPISHAAPLANAKIPIFIIHGDSDRTVPLAENGGPFVATYTGLGGAAELFVVQGKGHEEVDEYFKSKRLLEFLLNHLVIAAHQ